MAAAATLLLGGCQAIAITAAGIGASTGLTHTANSISSRTFTASEEQVKQATLIALGKMGMKLKSSEKNEAIEIIRASVGDRSVEVEVETLNESTTRISTSAQRGLFSYDGATAREIVAQTEFAMAELAQSRRARAPAKPAPSLADSTMGAAAPIRR
ncbi:MAG: DUF3568 family protein [Burkholderiaceae bacterium]